ncbi:MAG: CotH kinase family protein [Firmicutes bacterium]|nr:CotH kinase family protein [Dethiobacter sp.]MBS3889790.1 CotH kinase family protein [Bacillota bacterium]
MNAKCLRVLLVIALLTPLLSACQRSTMPRDSAELARTPDFVYNRDVYINDEDGSLKYLYVTVKGGGKYTLSDVEGDRYGSDDFEPTVEVVFQEGDAEGPVAGYYGFGLNDSNATLEVRGATSRLARQKSYKLRLDRRMSAWNGLWTINLNKHPYDLTRVRNKLSFDYMEVIPHIAGLRTQFVQLFIRDLSKNPAATGFVDYGLFTMVEQPNNLFLRVRGLDTEGHLYKAEFFEFHRYPDHLKHQEDPDYDEGKFQQILGIRGNQDHSKLLGMLDDVNNLELDINDVVDKHFNRNNYLTWLAVNILFGNIDTRTQNFMLYSPSDSDAWYFLPWDYDGAWGFYGQLGKDRELRRGRWEKGASNYWGVVLHRRFLQEPENVQALVAKMEHLLETIITTDRTRALLGAYHPVVSRFVGRMPDAEYLNTADFEQEFWRIVEEPTKNLAEFRQALENPMPVFLGVPFREGEKLVFRWSESDDLQGDTIVYDLEVSRTPDFAEILIRQTDLVKNEVALNPLPAGAYFWRVLIRDSKGNHQTAFDRYLSEDNVNYLGVSRFEVD